MDKIISFSAPMDLRLRLIEMARREERSVSWVVRRACEAWLDEMERPAVGVRVMSD